MRCKVVLFLMFALSFATLARTQTTNRAVHNTSGSLEPGQADQVATSTTSLATPAKWSHPSTEVRGIWFASQDLLATRTELLAKLDAAATANFNTVMLDTWFRGYVTYPGSSIVPQFPKFAGEDVLGWAISEAHKRGMRADLWISYGFYAYYAPDATADKSMGPLLDKHPELTALDATGKKYLHNKTLGDFYSLCPANPKSHELLGQIMAEALTKYPADGLHLDRIRFPEANYCYCTHCRKAFKRETGEQLQTEAGVENKSDVFLQWKREQTAVAVAHFQKVARTAKPGINLTSYVVGPAEMDSRGQSWDLWIKRGLLDAVAVSMYGPDIHAPTKRALQLIGGNPAKLIQAISCAQPTPLYLSNIEACRSYKALGQMTWYVGDVMDDIEGLKSGPYSAPAISPFVLLPR